jgi:hypothetical protein
VNGVQSYSCNCTGTGYQGTTCTQLIDDCPSPSPCGPHGACLDGLKNFTCVCDPGWYGARCNYTVLSASSCLSRYDFDLRDEQDIQKPIVVTPTDLENSGTLTISSNQLGLNRIASLVISEYATPVTDQPYASRPSAPTRVRTLPVNLFPPGSAGITGSKLQTTPATRAVDITVLDGRQSVKVLALDFEGHPVSCLRYQPTVGPQAALGLSSGGLGVKRNAV